MATMWKAAVLGLLLAVSSVTYADVVHLKNNAKSPGKTNCAQHAKTADEHGSASENINFAFADAYGTKTYGPSSTLAPPFASADAGSFSSTAESIPYSSPTPAPFAFDAGSFSSTATSAPIGSPTPAPFAFDSGDLSSTAKSVLLGSSTPAPFAFDAASLSSTAKSVLFGSSTPAPFTSDAGLAYSSVGPAPEPVLTNRSPAFATAYGASFSSYAAPPFAQGPAVVRTNSYDAAPAFAVAAASAVAGAPAPGHEVTISREVPVPYYVQVEKRVPYPVLVRVPHPYPVTVEKHVPYAVRVHVDRAVPVPQPYPVTVEKRVPYAVERPVPYPVRVPVDRPYAVRVPYEKPVPYAVERPVPYPVRVPVDRPYPVEKPVPYPVPVEKPVPYAVERPVPYPVERPVPYPVEKRVPYPVKYEVPVNVPVPVQVRVPVAVDRPVPYPVETRVPYPVRVPYEVRVPVPVQAPIQRFATVHYYQQSPVQLVGYGAPAAAGQSGYKASPAADGSAFQGSAPAPVSGYVAATATGASPQGSVGFDEGQKNVGTAAVFGTSTPTPFNAFFAGSYSNDGASSVKSDFDSFAQQAVAVGGSALRSQQTGGRGDFGQQTFFGTSTPAPFNAFSAGSSTPSYASSNFDSIAQQAIAVGGSALRSQQTGAGGDFGQQTFFGTSTPAPFNAFSAGSSTPSYASSDFDSVAQQAVAIGGSAVRSQRDNLAGGR